MEVVPPISYIVAVDIKNTDASAEWIGSPRKDLESLTELAKFLQTGRSYVVVPCSPSTEIDVLGNRRERMT
jgi:hypothetical protein